MISKSFSRLMVFTVHIDTKNHNINILGIHIVHKTCLVCK